MPAARAIADGFPRASEADWTRLVERAKSDPRRLTGQSFDGIPIGPVSPPGHGPVLPMRPAGAPWAIIQRIDRGDAGSLPRSIAAAIAGGAKGVDLVYASSPAAYGRGLDPRVVPSLDGTALVRLDAGIETPRIARALGASGMHLAYDPLATLSATAGAGLDDASVAGIFAGLAAIVVEEEAATAFAADGRLWHNGGATEVQELGIALASIVDSLRRLAPHGCPPPQAARRLGVILAADADQFLTLAKFRAMRLLLARLAEIADIAVAPPIHAETSWRMIGSREPAMNLVRATTAAFAAATGGADSITVLSPGFDDAPFADRMARNVQTILLEESSLYRAADPGAGSGAIEDLTARLAASAWDLFTGIEREGGLLAAIRSGSVTRAVATSRAARLEAVARRRMQLVGINVDVDAGAPLAAAPESDANAVAPLSAVRLGAPIESVAARAAGRRLALLRAGGGSGAGLADVLAALGFTVGTVRNPAEIAADPPPILYVDVGAEAAAEGEALAHALRAAAPDALLVAVTHPAAEMPAGFDAVVAADADLVTLCAGLLDRIAERQENGQV